MKRRLTFSLDDFVVELLDELVERFSISRSEAVGQILRTDLPRHLEDEAFVTFRSYPAQLEIQ